MTLADIVGGALWWCLIGNAVWRTSAFWPRVITGGLIIGGILGGIVAFLFHIDFSYSAATGMSLGGLILFLLKWIQLLLS
ncbi:MAG: hypothetical protein ACKOX2_19610 [Microcystaceae cyanobacterium]